MRDSPLEESRHKMLSFKLRYDLIREIDQMEEVRRGRGSKEEEEDG
jgi:hypothetical protein